MEGIIVLNEYTRMADTPFQIGMVPELIWYIAGILVVAMVISIFFIREPSKSAAVATACLTGAILVAVVGLMIAYNRGRVERTYQEIYMPGLVDMKEFNKTYDIVGREGDIYTVTFRNTDTLEEQ